MRRVQPNTRHRILDRATLRTTPAREAVIADSSGLRAQSRPTAPVPATRAVGSGRQPTARAGKLLMAFRQASLRRVDESCCRINAELTRQPLASRSLTLC